jgi:hypothetical protein
MSAEKRNGEVVGQKRGRRHARRLNPIRPNLILAMLMAHGRLLHVHLVARHVAGLDRRPYAVTLDRAQFRAGVRRKADLSQ